MTVWRRGRERVGIKSDVRSDNCLAECDSVPCPQVINVRWGY